MTDQLAIAALVAVTLALAFVALQLVTERRHSGLAGIVAALFAALVAVTTGSSGGGLDWLGDATRRSDAIGIGITFAMAAIGTGIVAGRAWRTSWAQIAVAVSGIVGVGGGLAAVALGRATAHWEFIAIVTSGAVLALIGLLGALHRGAPPNRRILLGGLVAFGAFAVVGGAALGIAWSSLA